MLVLRVLVSAAEVCIGGTGLVSTWFSVYSWVVSTPRSVPVYTSCT